MTRDRTLEQLRRLRQRGLTRAEEGIMRAERGLRQAEATVCAARAAIDEHKAVARQEEKTLLGRMTARLAGASDLARQQAALDGAAAEARRRHARAAAAGEEREAQAAVLAEARQELQRRRRKLAKLDLLLDERKGRMLRREEALVEAEAEDRAAALAGSSHGAPSSRS